MVHIAMFDAINAVEGGRYSPYLSSLPTAPADASSVAAGASAAHGVLVRLFPGQKAALAAQLAISLASVPDGPPESEGVAYGDQIAEAVYSARLHDNILAPGPVYVPQPVPGDYQITTPGPPQPVNTNAPNWVPFALRSASQFRPNGPQRLESRQYARDLEETKAWGGTVSANRNAEHEEIARWHTEQAQFQFNRIAVAEVQDDGRSLVDHARLFALLNMALADAVTAVFDAKYAYRFWRPVTAINHADVDDNDRTQVDLSWTPFLTTPPHPEYPAAHGAVQGAGAEVLSRYLGPQYRFETTSPTVPGVTRRYASIESFAAEGAFARILGGMHFRSSLEDGSHLGKKVANWALSHFLTPGGR
jgi:hypothetical protein